MNVTPVYYLCSTGSCNCRVDGVPAQDKRKLSFDTFTFEFIYTRFLLNFNVGLNMLL